MADLFPLVGDAVGNKALIAQKEENDKLWAKYKALKKFTDETVNAKILAVINEDLWSDEYPGEDWYHMATAYTFEKFEDNESDYKWKMIFEDSNQLKASDLEDFHLSFLNGLIECYPDSDYECEIFDIQPDHVVVRFTWRSDQMIDGTTKVTLYLTVYGWVPDEDDMNADMCFDHVNDEVPKKQPNISVKFTHCCIGGNDAIDRIATRLTAL